MQKIKLFAGSFLTALFLLPAFCLAQTVSIVSGNGQLVCPDCTGIPGLYAPLVVQVNGTTGTPSANTTVTWTATQQGYQPVTSTSTTNSAGQATYNFSPLAFFFGSNFLPATIVASALGTSVQFVETTATPNESGAAPVFVNLIPPTSPPALVGTAGQTASTPIQVAVLSFLGALPGVQVRIQSGTAGQPTVSCATQAGQQAGTVLTDSAGTATCTPVFGSQLGKGSYTLIVGGNFVNFGAVSLTVNPGPPALMKIISGNNQSANPGVLAPGALVVEVTDLGGNPSSDVAVKWSVTEGSATLGNVVTSTLSNGEASASVTPIQGPVQITVALATNSAVSAVFTINVNTIITALQYVSGNNQNAKLGAPFADPLVVQVNDNSLPVQGAIVSFAVTSGSATLSASSATSNAAGQAQVTAAAGATAGPVVITASVKSGSATYTETFNLTVLPLGPIITSVVNSAGFQNQFVSPCSLATIYGSGLADSLQGVADAFIEPQTQVAGVTVQFGGVLAPILDVANVGGVESVSVQVPCEVPSSSAVPPATVQMVVTADSAASVPFPVTVLPLSPGIFQFLDSDGKTRAVLIRPDGSFASVTNPVGLGETVRMFVTGLGQTTPALFTNEFDPLIDLNGTLVPQALPVNVSVVVGVNNSGVLVLSAQYAYGMVGVYQVEFQVPQDTATGSDAPFAIAIYQNQGTTLLFGNGSLIAIQQ
jgi:uncharacterized protein (TIGR03437 family)